MKGSGMSDRKSRLIEIIKRLPKGLRSDCQGTNHFELHTPEHPFWMTMDDIFHELKELKGLNAQGGVGVPLAEVFDAACAARELVEGLEQCDE